MPAPPAKNNIVGSGSTPSNAQARAGFDALWENLYGNSGLLGSTGLAADARNALGIGSLFSFRNKLINGNFALNQRNYASGAATTVANQYTLDRWRVVTSGQSITYTTSGIGRAVVFPAGGGEQVIKGENIEGGIYTLSWIGAGTATVNGVAIANGGQTSSLTAGANVTVKFVGAVQQAQFEPVVVTPFEQRYPKLEMMLAREYCFRNSSAGQGLVGAGLAYASTNAAFFIPFPTQMRAAPTLSSSNLYITNGAGSLLSPTGSAILAITNDSALVQINVSSGLTPGQASLLYAGNGSGGFIGFDSEL